ncbi:MAG: hypothetical protein WCA81_04805 [Rhizomicrobium sp.]
MAYKSKKSAQSPRKRRTRARKRKTQKRRVLRTYRFNSRLEAGLRQMRNGASLSEAAGKIGVTASRLREYVRATGVVERKDGKWHFKRDRRFRRMPMYSDGKRIVITVHNSKTASLIGAYMRAVRLFFETEKTALLKPFHEKSVPDVNGKRYIFETRRNVLFRLDASGIEPFEFVYAIVKPE